MIIRLEVFGNQPSVRVIGIPSYFFANARLLDQICPKCGASVACIYWDNGAGIYFNDNFVHQCTNSDCNHQTTIHSEKSGGSSPYEDYWPNCPFCNRKVGC
jgi:hypothetical protein